MSPGDARTRRRGIELDRPGSPLTLGGAEIGALLDALDHGVARLRAGRVIAASPALEYWCGVESGGLAGRPVREWLCDPEGRALATPIAGPLRIREADGRLRPVSAVPLGSNLWLWIDRSRERELEQELWEMARVAAARPAEPTADGEGLLEHELGTTTTVIQGWLRMLETRCGERLGEEPQAWLREARRATGSLAALSQELVRSVRERARSGPDGDDALRLSFKPCLLEQVAERAGVAATPILDHAEVGLHVDVEPGSAGRSLSADPDWLERVVLNLICNAARHAPVGSEIGIELAEVELESGSALCLTVVDEGPGVSQADAERIFEAFERAGDAGDHGLALGPGVGLGLHLCRRVVEGHGGSISAIPDLGRGVFRMVLPLEERCAAGGGGEAR